MTDAGFTAIELMPVADFAGRRNWGYDGVLLYAPDSAYGRPDDLRALFDQHGVSATFFVTHAGVRLPGHERGLHPNFRQNGDTYRAPHEILSDRGIIVSWLENVASTTTFKYSERTATDGPRRG